MTSSELVRTTPERATQPLELTEPEALQAVRHELIDSVNDLVARLQFLIDLETDYTIQQDFYLYRGVYKGSTFETQLARVHALARVSYDKYCLVFNVGTPDQYWLQRREDLIAYYDQQLAARQPASASGHINHAVYVSAHPWIKRQASRLSVELPAVSHQLVADSTELIGCLRALVDCDFTQPLPQPIARYEFVKAKVSHLAIMRILLHHLEQPHSEPDWADFKQRYFIGGVEPVEYVQYLQYYVNRFDKYLHYIETGELLK